MRQSWLGVEDLLGRAVDDGVDQVVLVGEVVVELSLADIGGRSDIVERRSGHSALEHQCAGLLEDAVAGRAALFGTSFGDGHHPTDDSASGPAGPLCYASTSIGLSVQK